MQVPTPVASAVRMLENHGFEAYVVGGCVRDSLLGLTPHDWDICTSALPEEMQAVFDGFRVIETGKAHGTLTVLVDGMPLEITTYRVDGAYSDHRRPDGVRFVSRIEEDLARRDFTVNSMAWHPEHGLRDPFGGEEDLRKRLLRAVGDPGLRFEEDALRIMRALRFAAAYGLRIDPATATALRQKRTLLGFVAAERLRAELDRLLTAADVESILSDYPDVLAVFLPFISSMVGFEQHSVYHHLDVWQHTATAVGASVPDLPVRLALLLHDAGKPARYTVDEEGRGHFYGHASVSAALAEETLYALRYDRKTMETVIRLVKYHDTPDPAGTTRGQAMAGPARGRGVPHAARSQAGRCERAAAPAVVSASLSAVDGVEDCLNRVIAEGACFSVRDLAVDGRDAIAVGVPEGPEIGKALAALTEAVIDGVWPQ